MKATLDISILTINFAMMTVVGMALEARHFTELGRRKRLIATALLAQMALLPAIGWSIAKGLALPPHLSAGLLLMAACPVGDIASFYTVLARVNTALAVAVNTLSCLLAALTMPIVVGLYARLAGERFAFAAPPIQLVTRVMLMTAVPIAAGMALRRVTPRFVARIAPAVQTACIAAVAGIVILVVVVQADIIAADWKPAVAASFALMILAVAAGWALGAFLRLDAAERFTFSVVFAVRNVALAMAVAITLLGRVDYAAFAVVYFLTEVPLLLGLVGICRWRQARSESLPCAEVTR